MLWYHLQKKTQIRETIPPIIYIFYLILNNLILTFAQSSNLVANCILWPMYFPLALLNTLANFASETIFWDVVEEIALLV